MYIETCHNENRMLRFNIIDLTLEDMISLVVALEPGANKNNLPIKLANQITEAANLEIEKLIVICN